MANTLISRLAVEEAAADIAAMQGQVGDVDGETDLTPSEVDEELGSATDAQTQEVVDDADTLNTTEDNMESLENARDYLIVAANGKGMSQHTAHVYHILECNIANNLGIHPSTLASSSSYSLESFSSSSDRLASTKICLEETESRIKAFFKAIWDFIRNMIKKVISVVAGFFDSAAKLETHANKVKTKASQYKGKFKTDLSASQAKTYGDVFGIDGSAKDSLKSIVSDVVKTQAKMKSDWYIHEVGSYLKNVISGATANRFLQDFTTDVQLDVRSNVAFVKKVWYAIGVYDLFGNNGADIANKLGAKEARNVRQFWDKGPGKYYQSDALPGGYTLNMYIKGGDKDKGELPVVATAWLRTNKPTADVKFGNKYLPKSPGDVKDICDMVIKIAKTHKATIKAIKDFQEDMKSHIDKFEKECAKINEGSARAAAQRLASMVKRSYASISGPFVAMVKYMLYLGKKSLDLCSLTMSEGNATKVAK